MDDKESERQKKLKAGREKLLQFQQKKRGEKKKKKASSKSEKSDTAGGSKHKDSKHGACSPPNSDPDPSIESVDTEKDVSSIASDADCKRKVLEQEQQLAAEHEEGSITGSYTSGSYASGEDSYASEDGGVDELVIANLERNELKNRNLELEEQLVAKKIALKDISKENAELKSKVDYLLQTTQGGHALEQFESSKEIDNLKKTLNNLQSTVDDLQKENGQLRKRIEEYKGLDRSESSQVEDLKAELMTRQVTVAELNQQNENLSEEVDTLKMKLNDSLMENLRMKENDVQQLRIENEQQRVRIKSLENGLNQSKEQLSEFHEILQIKDQELYQLSNVKAYSETLRQNIAELNKQLIQKNQEMQMVCQERDQKLWQASQEVTRLQQILIDKEKDSENGACDMQTVQEYESKISEVMGQLVEKDRALETMKNQLTQMMNQQKRGEEEIFLLKSHVQEQTEKILSSEEELRRYSSACREKENRISILEQQLGSLSQTNEERSKSSEKISQQMLELQNLLNDRNQKISHLEISLSEVSEERELMRSEMTKQSQELLEQVRDLRARLDESNAKLKEQSDEMENSFSELHITQNMIKDLQKEMLEKDLSLDNLSQQLRSTEVNHKEVLEGLQKKFIEEKERLQNELVEKQEMVNKLNPAYLAIQQQLNYEKSIGDNLRVKIENLDAEIRNHRNEAMNLRNQLIAKEEAFNDLDRDFNLRKQQQHEEIESLKLELEKVKETIPDSNQRDIEVFKMYEEQLNQLKTEVVQKESRVRELSSYSEERDQKIAHLETEVSEKQQTIDDLREQLNNIEQEHDEEVLNLKTNLEKQEVFTKTVEENLLMDLGQMQSHHQNEISSLKNEHAGQMSRLRQELDEKCEELKALRSYTESRIEDELIKAREQHKKETESLQMINKELEGKLQEAELRLSDSAVDEKNFLSLKEQLEHQKEEYEKAIKLCESLAIEKDELLSKREVHFTKEIQYGKEVELLNNKITTLECELHKSQTNNGEILKEKEHYEELFRNAELANEQKVLSLSEELRHQKEDHESEVELLQNRMYEIQQNQEGVLQEKEQVKELVKQTEEKLYEKEKQHENEIKQMDDQLEQTRQVMETIRTDSEKKIANLEESFHVATDELQRRLLQKEQEHKDVVESMTKVYEDLKTELEKEKSYSVDIKEQLQALVKEKEELKTEEEIDLHSFDWTSDSFKQQPLVEENVTAENEMENQATGDGLSLFTDDKNSPGQLEGLERFNEVDIPKKSEIFQLDSTNQLDSLQQVSFLREKLAEKAKSELELIEEKNKLLKIVKEYNESLANERDNLKERIIDQDQTIKDLQEQLSTSELVSADLQQVFGRQLLVLQEQRDSLLGQLEEQKKERSSFVDILEEKHALEENLRSEKEQLADKLRQKEILEVQLEQERAALQEQLIRQARLNEIIREKDVLEEELIEQKNRLQLELSTIEKSLLEKEQLLQKEKETLRVELLQKDQELHSWQGEFKTKAEQLVLERERLEKAYTDTLLSTRTELEDTYQLSLQHLRTELETGYKQRLLEMESDFQSHHEEQVASLAKQHEQQVAGLKTEYEEKIEHLKGILDEQRRKQVSTMKNVLERDREKEVEHLMDSHDNDMQKLRKELNIRHQDIVNAIVDRLKQSHQQEMEDCLAGAISDTVLKVEAARLEVEREYDAKFDEVREKAKFEVEHLKRKHEAETKELWDNCQKQLEKIEQLEKHNVTVTEELDAQFQKRLTSELEELRKNMNQEHEKNLENMRQEIEQQYEDQIENLQDDIETKYDTNLRELREELDKQAHQITGAAVEELQQKHISEINTLKLEHEHVYEQMNTVREKLEASYKEDIKDLEEKLNRAREKEKEMSSRMERIVEEWKRDEKERTDTLRIKVEKNVAFQEQEHENKIADIKKNFEKQLAEKDQAYGEELQRLHGEFDKERMAIELNHFKELQEISAEADKRIAEKEQKHVSEIDEMQQKLILLREDGEEARFREVDESRQQLSEKYQRDLDAIVRELKVQHQKQIDNLISEAESNQVVLEREEFEQWKIRVVEKNDKEMRELRNSHQKELEETRKLMEEERLEEVSRVCSALSVKHEREMAELRKQLNKEYEEDLEKMKMENQSNYEKEIRNLSAENQLMKQQHDETLKDVELKLTGALTQEVEPLKQELRVCKDLVQEKDLEIESLKRDHNKEMKELKQGHFEDLLEEVSQVRSDLAVDAAREVELVKIESEYELTKKVKEIQDAHLKEIADHAARLKSAEKRNETLNELLQSHAREILELKKQLEKEKHELNEAHNEAIQDLKTKLHVEQQNALNELKVRLMNEMSEMQEVFKNASEDEYKKIEANFLQRESQLKDMELKEREEILDSLKQDHEKEILQLRESLNHDNENAVNDLKRSYEGKIRDIEEKFTLEMKTERERLEMEKEKDLATLEEALGGSINEKQELQLRLINEQHSRELESLREQLVKTHMEKFTLMTEQLEQAHQEELEQVRRRVQETTRREFQTKLEQAEELARYNLEEEHIENLKKLEENLQKKHEGQLKALNDLLVHHQGQLKRLNEDHAMEKQEIISEWQKKLANELTAVKDNHQQEIAIKSELLNKAETELKHYVLEAETKDKDLNEMTEFIEATSAEYEKRLKNMRREFDAKLEEMKCNVDSTHEVEIRGIQESLSKQHTEELGRLKEEHEKHIRLVNDELKGAHVMKAKIQEESEQKLLENATIATEQEQILKNRICELEEKVTAELINNKILTVRNDDIQNAFELKEIEFNELREEKQAVDVDFRTLETHVREMVNRHERERLEDTNLIKMLRADLDVLNSERDSLQRAKDNLLRLLSTAVKTTLVTEETITSRLETLIEQTMRDEDQDSDTVSEVNSISEAEDSIPEGFRRRQGVPSLATSTPAVGVSTARALDDAEDGDKTLTDDGAKQGEVSFVSDEGLELSAMLSDSINQGSLDILNEETVIDSGNRLRIAVKKLLEMVASVTNQLNDARGTQDELLNTTAQRTEELNQLTQAQQVLMARLQEEIESKDDITNRLRKAEEDMEAHIAEIDRLEKLLKEKVGENNDQAYVQKQKVVEALEKEKEELLGNVESFKSEIEEMAKSYEKEKQDLCEKISELQLKVSQMDGELKVKKTLEVELQNSQVLRRQVAEERDELLKKLRDSQVVERKTVSTEMDDSQAVIESLKLECISRETEIEQFKQTENQLRSEVLTLKQSKLDLEHKLHENSQELLKQKQEHEDEIERLKLVLVETQTGVRPEQGVVEEEVFEKDQVFTPVTGDAEPVKENRLLKQEVGTLKATIENLKVDLQNASDEKAALQNTFEQCEVTWENEKNTLQQQLYDSCLEASSFKERLSQSKLVVGDVAEVKERMAEQKQAYENLEDHAINLEDMVNDLKKSLSLKEGEISVLGQKIDELKQTLNSQQNILDEQRDLLMQAENTKISDEERISTLRDALTEAEIKVNEGEVKMQEILTNMRNLEETYKAQTTRATQQLNKQVDVLQKELSEYKIKLDQQKELSGITIANQIADLKQNHSEEIQSLRTQFETEIRDAVKRTKTGPQKLEDGYRKEISQNDPTESQEDTFNPDSSVMTRLNIAIMENDGFTETIAGYLSDFSMLRQRSFDQDEVSDNSTSEKMEAIVDDVKTEADAIYNLVNTLPAFYDPHAKSLRMAWTEEKEILIKTIKQLKEIATQKPEEISRDKDWRTTILSAVLDLLCKEEEMLSSELQAMELLTRTDATAMSKLIERRQQSQDALHRQSVEKLYQTDRISLLNEICELQNTLASVKEELTHENDRLQEQLRCIQDQVQKREKEFVQQVALKETLVKQERDVTHGLRAEREVDKNRLNEANDLLIRERLLIKDLQNMLNKDKTRLSVLEVALEKERTQNAVLQTCLDSERARCSNLEQALKRERLNVESKEQEVERKSKLLQDISAQERENIEELKTTVLQGKQQLSELEAQLREEKARNAMLETEIGDHRNTSASDKEKLGVVIQDLKEELQNQKSRNSELVKSLDEERKVSEELKCSLESVNGVNEQIAELEQLITELRQALDKERRVNEELRNALDSEYESIDKSDERQLNIVKELQTSLTAVQKQLQNQIEVVDQERIRAKRLRKERDIHEATAMGARDKERKLETVLQRERTAREREIATLKDVLEREVAQKRNLQETINKRNTEFDVLYEELQRLKDYKSSESAQVPTSPSQERLNILRHDLRCLIDEHRLLLMMHKDYLAQESKILDRAKETSNFSSHVENLLDEIDRVKAQLNTISEGPSIPLSPLKAAVYQRINEQNKVLADYVARLTEDKAELRTALTNLELQASKYREHEANNEENSRRSKLELESMLTAERSRFAQDQLKFSKTVEGHKRRVDDMEKKLRDKENELDETKRTLRVVEDELEKSRGLAKRLQLAESHFAKWTPARIQKLYGRYMRAEKSRKSLKYQKRYLVLLLGGFRESETRTLSLIAKMGAYPSFQQPTSRFPPGFTKFRIAVRVVIAMKRMVFLVRKSKNSIRQVIEPNDPTLQRNPPKDITADLKTSNYSSHKSEDRYISSYPQVPLPQNVSSRLHPELTKVNDYRHDIRSEPKDISFDGKCTFNTTALDHLNQGDSGIYPRYYNNRNETSSSLKFCDATSTGTFLPIYQATSDLTNKPETSNQSVFHSPPVRERTSGHQPTRAGIGRRYPGSFQAYPLRGETLSRNDPDIYPLYDSQDLDRKIQTLDSLQQKLSVTRGLNERTKRF